MSSDTELQPGRAQAITLVDRCSDACLFLVLFLSATLPYANTLFHSFVYDDVKQVLANPYLTSWRYLPDIFGSNVWSFLGSAGVTNHYRPMMTLSYLVCFQLFGPLPFGFHLVNLILHAAVVWTLFRVTEHLFGSRAIGFIAALLFALHPIHTESVAWVAGITDLQLAFFYLLTFRLFLRLDQREASPQWGLQLALLASFTLTLLSKEIAATLPVLATFYEHVVRPDRVHTTRGQKLRRYGPLWILLGLYISFRIFFLGAIAPVLRRELPTWPEAILSGFSLFAQYLWKLLWPAELCAFYVFRESTSLTSPPVLAGLLVVIGFLVLLAFSWRRNRTVCFALLWFLVTLAPVMNARWMAANVFAERYLYLPSVGFCWLLAWLWKQGLVLPEKTVAWRRALATALTLVAVLYAARVVTRNQDWRDDESLYLQTLSVSPDAYLIRSNLGTVYWNRGQEEAAIREWRTALESQPEDPVLLNNLGLAAARRQRLDEAGGFFRRSILARPDYPEPYVNWGRALETAGQIGAAEHQYRAAIERAPLDPNPRNHLGSLLLARNQTDEAEQQFRLSTQARPTAGGFTGLGLVLLAKKQPDAAQAAFRQALILEPYGLEAHLGLGRALVAAGKEEEARREFESVLVLSPQNAEALGELRKLGDSEKLPGK